MSYPVFVFTFNPERMETLWQSYTRGKYRIPWAKVEPLIPLPKRDPNKTYKRKPGAGRKPIAPRRVFEAIVYVLRTGCQWKALPKETYGSPSAIHAHFMRWTEAGFFLSLWRAPG